MAGRNRFLENSWRDFCQRQQMGASSYLRLSSIPLDVDGLKFFEQRLQLTKERPTSVCFDHCYFYRVEPQEAEERLEMLRRIFALFLENGLHHLRLWGPLSGVLLEAFVSCRQGIALGIQPRFPQKTMKTFQLHDIAFHGEEKGILLKQLFSQHNEIENLELQRCYLDTESVAPFAEGLSSFSTLKSLHIWNSYMSDEVLSVLSKGLMTHKNLERLILRTNSLSSKSLPNLSSILLAFQKLETLDLAYNCDLFNLESVAQSFVRRFLQEIQDHSVLSRLHLRVCGMGPEMAKAFFLMLEQGSMIRDLDLGGNLHLGEEWATSLRNIHQLQKLTLPRTIPLELLGQSTSLLELRFDNQSMSYAFPILKRNKLLRQAKQVILHKSNCVHRQQSHQDDIVWPFALQILSGQDGEGSSAIFEVVQSVLVERTS